MCGIAGIILNQNATLPDVRDPLEKMMSAMHHRGPDGRGLYLLPNDRGGLVNTRLAVRDLTPAGHMPMSTDDGRLTITYNGEIYNAGELRAELEAAGCAFRSTGDTEVILKGYQRWGSGVAVRLNGIFAFAIHDARENSLFLSRDRFGVKPLYYSLDANRLIFASEVRAILASGLVPRVVNRTAIEGFLMLGSVPDDRTIIEDVESFAPASHATVALDQKPETRNQELASTTYWSHADEFASAPPIPGCEVEEYARETFKTAVKRQMISDVPLGLFLSGGIDSSALAAFMRAAGITDDLRSVSIAFNESDYNEGPEARKVADRFGFDHTERVVTADEVRDRLPEIIAAMDQPTVDGINTFFVSETARQAGLTVALSGLGADELFGGYKTFQDVPRVLELTSRAARLPYGVDAVRLISRLPRIPYRARKLAAWMPRVPSLASAYLTARGLLSRDQVQALLPWPVTFNPVAYVQSAVEPSTINHQPSTAVSLLESRLYMHNQLLRDTDAMSMAHSLEVRVPYLDASLPALSGAPMQPWQKAPKATLGRARSVYFPLGLGDPPKAGFTFPLDKWLRTSTLASGGDTARADLFSRERYRSLIADFESNRVHWSHVWAPSAASRWLESCGAHVSG